MYGKLVYQWHACGSTTAVHIQTSQWLQAINVNGHITYSYLYFTNIMTLIQKYQNITARKNSVAIQLGNSSLFKMSFSYMSFVFRHDINECAAIYKILPHPPHCILSHIPSIAVFQSPSPHHHHLLTFGTSFHLKTNRTYVVTFPLRVHKTTCRRMHIHGGTFLSCTDESLQRT